MTDIKRRRRNGSRANLSIKWIASARQAEQKEPAAIGDPAFYDKLSLASNNAPAVFRTLIALKILRESGESRLNEKPALSVALLTAEQAEESIRDNDPVEEDLMSHESFLPFALNPFDRSKRTLLERFFAVYRDVRKGLLQKHRKKGRLQELSLEKDMPPRDAVANHLNSPRALVM